MTRINTNKLNHMVLSMPYCSVITSEWLHEHGISSKLAWWYVKSGWLERISDKAYKKPHENILWTGVVSALQLQLKKPIHISGKSALELTGKARYLPMNNRISIDLATEEKVTLPTWLKSKNISANNIEIHQNKLLNGNIYEEFLIQREINGQDITLACAELAILEILILVTNKQDFIEAAELMEGLPYLRVNKVQLLLEKCTSIKAKRLYLYLAAKNNHGWFKKLNLEKIDLGKGKRMIIKGGVYDAEFQITVPMLDEE